MQGALQIVLGFLFAGSYSGSKYSLKYEVN